MNRIFSYVMLGILAVLVVGLEVPQMLKKRQYGELWAFIGVGTFAFALLTLAIASVSFASLDEAWVAYIKPYLDPIIQAPPE